MEKVWKGFLAFVPHNHHPKNWEWYQDPCLLARVFFSMSFRVVPNIPDTSNTRVGAALAYGETSQKHLEIHTPGRRSRTSGGGRVAHRTSPVNGALTCFNPQFFWDVIRREVCRVGFDQRNPKPETRNPKPTVKVGFELRNPKPETRNPKPTLKT